MTPTGHEPGQTFPVVQDKCAHNTASDKADDEASKNELRFRSEHLRVTIMVEMVDVASFHTTGTRAESHRQNVVVPTRQIQDDRLK